MITTDSILADLQGLVRDKHPVGPEVWLDAAAQLTVLVSDEQNKLFLLEQKVAEKKFALINEMGYSVAKAKVRIEASEEYLQVRILEAKIDQVTELVRIAKVQARMSSDNIKNYS